jgi:putative flippase GtrA
MVNRVKRFLRFNLICGIGVVINVGILWALTNLMGVYYLISNLFGIGASTLWNYGLNSNITWEVPVDRKVEKALGQEKIAVNTGYSPVQPKEKRTRFH